MDFASFLTVINRHRNEADQADLPKGVDAILRLIHEETESCKCCGPDEKSMHLLINLKQVVSELNFVVDAMQEQMQIDDYRDNVEDRLESGEIDMPRNHEELVALMTESFQSGMTTKESTEGDEVDEDSPTITSSFGRYSLN